MNRNELGLIKNYTATAAIAPFRIVAFSTELTDRNYAKVKPATGGNDALAGIIGIIGTVKANERVDVYKGDIQTLEFGGDILPGDPITSDAEGRGIKAAPAAGTAIRIIGFAEEPGEEGSQGAVHINPQIMRG